MPELPEVEVLVRHLRPLLEGKVIRGVRVFRPKVIRPTSVSALARTLTGAKFLALDRRGKYLLFRLQRPREKSAFTVLGHLGMTGRMYLVHHKASLPKHASVTMNLGRETFVFEDTRYFGRLTLSTSVIEHLGPEPLSHDFTIEYLQQSLRRSRQAIKIKLLDQALVAGIGNIYASEALFRAGVSPKTPARRVHRDAIHRLWGAIREVMAEAIEFGSTLPLNYQDTARRDGLFYFGSAPDAPDFYTERLLVYDRAALPCTTCGTLVKRIAQAGRSTFFCPQCQKSMPRRLNPKC